MQAEAVVTEAQILLRPRPVSRHTHMDSVARRTSVMLRCAASVPGEQPGSGG